jgi:polyisoprenoid-binding protein YceI
MGRGQAGRGDRNRDRPDGRPYGNDRIGLVLSAEVDRTDFGVGLTPLPSGDQALANDVKILADLQFVMAGA